MAKIVDSSVLITLERRNLGLSHLRPSLEKGDEKIALAAVTVSELLLGVYRADSAARRLRRESFLDTILEAVPVLPFDLPVARTYGRIWSELAAQGQLIGIHDAQIAATALTHGWGVLTENTRDFQRVPGLSVAAPTWL
ncbi:MAG: PIN domain-containing protein [Chloroflexi bacterium]|nr:PIN domain-containing protein [Chloroflexota bacterium]